MITIGFEGFRRLAEFFDPAGTLVIRLAKI